MSARLAFAICAHVDADILIVDEALSVGDQAFPGEVRDLLPRISRSDGTLLMVSHALGYLEQTCDRVIWIEDGYIRDVGATGPGCIAAVREGTRAQPTGHPSPVSRSEQNCGLSLLRDSAT